LFSFTHYLHLYILGEIQSLSANNKILSEKLSEQYSKYSREEINSRELEKKIFSLEDNLKKFRKVMFEKELGDRKIISDLKHNLSNASQLIRLNEMNKKADIEKKNDEISEIERIRAAYDSRLQQVSLLSDSLFIHSFLFSRYFSRYYVLTLLSSMIGFLLFYVFNISE
jgi:DNA mismatch repair ATPase MutS